MSSVLDYATNAPWRYSSLVRATRWLIIVAALTSMSSILVVYVQTERVMITGGLLLLLGLTTSVLAWRGRYPMALFVGIAHCAIVGICVTAVNICSWGPRQAKIPFLWIGIIYNCSLAPTSWIALRRAPRIHTPGLCKECGYILHGLIEPRCPECGTAFDPATLGPPTVFSSTS